MRDVALSIDIDHPRCGLRRFLEREKKAESHWSIPIVWTAKLSSKNLQVILAAFRRSLNRPPRDSIGHEKKGQTKTTFNNSCFASSRCSRWSMEENIFPFNKRREKVVCVYSEAFGSGRASGLGREKVERGCDVVGERKLIGIFFCLFLKENYRQ